jgi:tetratricopeptide (TPR) repeat protein
MLLKNTRNLPIIRTWRKAVRLPECSLSDDEGVVMGVLDFAVESDPFANINAVVEAKRVQVAQYAIYNAARKMSEGDLDGAIKGFKTALAFDSANTTALSYMGQIYQKQGKMSEAIKTLQKVVLADETSVDARNDLGNAYLQDKQYEKAEEQFKMASRLDPTDAVADYTLGLMYTETKRYKEAETQFKKVAKIEPKDGNVPYSLGVLYNKMGRSKDAVLQLKKALTLKDKFYSANYELGAAYVNLNDTQKAKEQLSILEAKGSELASDLEFLIDKPQIITIKEDQNVSFNSGLGGGTPIWMLDPAQLSTPGATLRVAVAIQFSNDMDPKSIMNLSNWTIGKGKGTQAGYYNYGMPVSPNEVNIPSQPYSVVYDATTRTAKVFFLVCQNSTIDIANGKFGATIDPSHLVFQFSGVDAAGRQMDSSANEVDGYSIWGF